MITQGKITFWSIVVLSCGLVFSLGFYFLYGDAQKSSIVPVKPDANLSVKQNEMKGVMLNVNVGIVDYQIIMQKSKEGNEINTELRKEAESLNKKAQDLQEKYSKSAKEYKDKESVLTESDRETEKQKLVDLERKYGRELQDDQEKLKATAEKKGDYLLNKCDEAAKSIAQESNLDILFDKTTGRIVYASEKVDMTSKVVNNMDVQYTQKKASSTRKA